MRFLITGTAGFIGFEKDVIPVGKNEGGFRQIRLKVRDRSITLREIRVVTAVSRSTSRPCAPANHSPGDPAASATHVPNRRMSTVPLSPTA